MEVTSNTKAIILSRKFFNEKDEKICLYSKDFGKLELISRGTKKTQSKLSGHLEPMNLVDLMIVSGRQYDYIGTAVSKNCFFNIKKDFQKIFLTQSFFLKIIEATKENQKEENIFYLLVNFLFLLDNLDDKKYWKLSFDLAVIKFFAFLGYLIDRNFLNKIKNVNGIEIFKYIYQKNILESFKNIKTNSGIEQLLSEASSYVIKKYQY